MKKLILAICLILSIMPFKVFAFNEANQVILSNENCIGKHCTPKTEEIKFIMQNLKQELNSRLNNPNIPSMDKDNIKGIISKFDQYLVQFIGYSTNDKNIIHCNFFKKYKNGSNSWKKKLVITLDGGNNYWQIDFDIKTKKFINLRINGEA